MRTVESVPTAHAWLGRLTFSRRHELRDGTARDRSMRLLRALGNPQERTRTVHVAGSAGKGSVVTMLEALLLVHGFRTGTTTSPHVDGVRDRLRINGQSISEPQLERYLAQVAASAERIELRPSFFEAITAASFLSFFDEEVDYAVVETGVGGRFDATNVIHRPDKLAVLTRICCDHPEVLGSESATVAQHKSGIVVTLGEAVSFRQTPEVDIQLRDAVATRGGTLISAPPLGGVVVGMDGTQFDYSGRLLDLPRLQLGLIGRHQAENAAVALAALESLALRDGFLLRPTAIRACLQQVRVPGRLELHQFGTWPVILDVAHGASKLETLHETLQDLGITGYRLLLARRKTGRQFSRTLRENATDVVEMYGTPTELKRRLKEAMVSTDRPVVIVGSFPLVGVARRAITELQ